MPAQTKETPRWGLDGDVMSCWLFLGFEVSLDESASSVSCIHTLANADLIEEEVRFI